MRVPLSWLTPPSTTGRLRPSLCLWSILNSSSTHSSFFSKEREYDKISKDHHQIFNLFTMLGLEIGVFQPIQQLLMEQENNRRVCRQWDHGFSQTGSEGSSWSLCSVQQSVCPTGVLRTERPKMKEDIFLIFDLELHRKYGCTFTTFRELQRIKKKYTAHSHHLLEDNQ